MALREYMRVYKKVNKAITLYIINHVGVSCSEVNSNWNNIFHAATTVVKALKTLHKLADAAGVDFNELINHSFSEDTFVMWAYSNGLEFSKESADETEENDE